MENHETNALVKNDPKNEIMSIENAPSDLQKRIENIWMDEKLDMLFMKKSEIMAKSNVLPQMFRGDQYACYSLQQLAYQWQVNPTLLAPGLYKATPNSPLSLDGKTVSSIIYRFAPVKDGYIKDEYFGDWDKILGKFETKTSKKQDDYGNFKTYKVPAWKPEDEQGLGIRLTATLLTGQTINYELKLTQCLTRNSTLWAEDPQLQIFYRAMARFSRKYFPYILNGMYIKEEFQDDPEVIDVTPVKTAEIAQEQPATKTEMLKQKLKIEKKTEEKKEDIKTAEVVTDKLSEYLQDYLKETNAPVGYDDCLKYLEDAKHISIDPDAPEFPADWKKYIMEHADVFVDHVFKFVEEK